MGKIKEQPIAGWTARALARLTGQPPSTVARWVADGLITAERYGRGRGGYTIGLLGLLELTAIIELQAAGFTGREIRRAVENLRQLLGYERPLAQITLVVCGNDIAWKSACELDSVPVSTLHAPGQRLMVFPVGERHAEWLSQLQSMEVRGYGHVTMSDILLTKTDDSGEARSMVNQHVA